MSWAWQKGRLEAWYNSGAQWKEGEWKNKASASKHRTQANIFKYTLDSSHLIKIHCEARSFSYWTFYFLVLLSGSIFSESNMCHQSPASPAPLRLSSRKVDGKKFQGLVRKAVSKSYTMNKGIISDSGCKEPVEWKIVFMQKSVWIFGQYWRDEAGIASTNLLSKNFDPGFPEI